MDHLRLNLGLGIILPNFYLLLFTLIYIYSFLYYLAHHFYFTPLSYLSYKFSFFPFEIQTGLFDCNELWTRFFILEFRFVAVNLEELIVVVAGEVEKKSHD